MYVLDTDALTHLFHGHERVSQKVRETAAVDVVITVIGKAEMLRGRIEFLLKAADAAELLRAPELLVRTEFWLGQLPLVYFEEAAAETFERLRQIRGL